MYTHIYIHAYIVIVEIEILKHQKFNMHASLKVLPACEESQLRCPVVFIDEAGLPEERTESLKAKALSQAFF